MNKSEQKEFEGLLDIDKTRLDEECERQPYLVWEYGRMSAKALRDVDDALSNLKLVEADVDAAVRDAPAKFGLDKINETAIKRAILRSEEFQEAQEQLNKAKYRVNVLEAANRSLDHRRTSLTMLDKQDERGYFARPTQKVRTDTGKSPHRKTLKKQ